MKTPLRWVLAAVVLIAVSGPGRAQDASLNLVPAKAPLVIQVNGFEKARERLGKFLGNSLPDIAPKLVKQLDDALKEAADGRDLKALTKDGRIYLVFHDLSTLTEMPQVSVLVPVSSYKAFKDGFLKEGERKNLKADGDGIESLKIDGRDETLYLVSKKDYVVVTNDKEIATSYTKADASGLGKALGTDTSKSFLAQDVAVYVNIKTVNREFGAKIRGFKTLLDLGLQGGGMGIDKKQIEMVKQMFNSLLALFDDGEAVVLGFDFRPEGANIHFLAQFGSDTETNAFLKKLKPEALKQLGTLPGGQLFYSATNFDTTQSKTLSAMMREQVADDEDEAAKKAIDKALKEIADNTRTVEISAHNNLAAGLEISEYKDGAKAVASQMSLFKALTKTGSFGSIPLKSKPVIKENAETVGDYKLHMVKFEFDFDKAVQDLPENVRDSTKNMMTKMAGEMGQIWIGNSGNKVLAVSSKDWKDAKTAIEDYLAGRSPLDQDESFKVTRQQLPKDATILAVADTARFIHLMLDMVKDSLAGIPGFPGGGALPNLPAPKGKPAYFGVAIVLKAEYTTFDMFVPVTAVQQVRKMFAPLIDMDN